MKNYRNVFSQERSDKLSRFTEYSFKMNEITEKIDGSKWCSVVLSGMQMTHMGRRTKKENLLFQ